MCSLLNSRSQKRSALAVNICVYKHVQVRHWQGSNRFVTVLQLRIIPLMWISLVKVSLYRTIAIVQTWPFLFCLLWHYTEKGALSLCHSYSLGSKLKAWGDLCFNLTFLMLFILSRRDVNASDLVRAVYCAQSCHNLEKATGLRGYKAIQNK